MNGARREWLRFLGGAGFLTRIPLPAAAGSELPPLRESARYFGLVGALVGAAAGAVWALAGAFLPAAAAAGVAVAAGLLLTGALHEDGLGDTFDALGARGGRERALEALRDSRIGTYGATALIAAVGLRWSVLASLPVWEGVLALIVAGATGRTAMVAAAAHSRPARADGLGASFAGPERGRDAAWCLAVPLILSLAVGWTGLLAVPAGLLAGLLLLSVAERALGGYTGDVLGAVGVCAELGAFAVLAGALA